MADDEFNDNQGQREKRQAANKQVGNAEQ